MGFIPALGAAEQFQSERGKPSGPVFGQERFEVGGIVERLSLGHPLAEQF